MISVTFKAKCSVCGKEEITEHGMIFGLAVPNPHFPSLRNVQGIWICYTHELTVRLEDKDGAARYQAL